MSYPHLIKDQHLSSVPAIQEIEVTHTNTNAEADGVYHLLGKDWIFHKGRDKNKNEI